MFYKWHMRCCCHASHKSTLTHGLRARAVQYTEGKRLGNFNGVHQMDSDRHASNRFNSNYSSDFKYTHPPLHHFKYTHPAHLPSVHYRFLGLPHKLWLKCTQSSSIHTKIITISSSDSCNNHFTFNSIHNREAVSPWHLKPNPLRVLFKFNLLTLRKCKQHNLCLVI